MSNGDLNARAIYGKINGVINEFGTTGMNGVENE